MASKRRWNVVFPIQTPEGQKSKWMNVGMLFENEKGDMNLKLDAMPVGNGFDGWLKCYPPKPQNGQGGGYNNSGGNGNGYNNNNQNPNQQQQPAQLAPDNPPAEDIPF
jgi:hypothetical protein